MRVRRISVHRDVNAMKILDTRFLGNAPRAAAFAAVLFGATLVPRAADAADWNDDTPSAESASPAPVTPPEHDLTDHDYRGYDIAIRPFALVMPSGALDRTTSFAGVGESAGLGIGAYPTRHLGLYLAADAVTQHSDDPARLRRSLLQSRYTASVEIAFDSRRTGFYLAPGIAYVTAHLDHEATYSGVDFELRAGFRIAPNPTAHPTRASVNIFAGVDYGRYAALSSGGVDSRIAIGDRADHSFFFIGVGIDLTR